MLPNNATCMIIMLVWRDFSGQVGLAKWAKWDKTWSHIYSKLLGNGSTIASCQCLSLIRRALSGQMGHGQMWVPRSTLAIKMLETWAGGTTFTRVVLGGFISLDDESLFWLG